MANRRLTYRATRNTSHKWIYAQAPNGTRVCIGNRIRFTANDGFGFLIGTVTSCSDNHRSLTVLVGDDEYGKSQTTISANQILNIQPL